MYPVHNPYDTPKKVTYVDPWERRQKTKSCGNYTLRGQYLHNVLQSRRLEAMYKTDEMYQEYLRIYPMQTRVGVPKKLLDSWWNDKIRRVEGNWKSQYKTNRQYNIRSRGRDVCSIRTLDFEEEEFSALDIEMMLEEDFENAAIK